MANPRRIDSAIALTIVLVASGCGINSAKNHFVLAEKLWNDRKYEAAVLEFEKVISRDPKGKLGLMALQRAATTQNLFLQQYPEAIRKLKQLAEASHEKEIVWDSQLQIGEILFAKTEDYNGALTHYLKMLQDFPNSPEAPEFMFRVGRCQFFLWRFDEAAATYQSIQKKFPKTPWSERALFELALTYFTRGEQRGIGKESYQEAIDLYQSFIRKYPKSERVVLAQFGIANSLEEMDQLDAAYNAYQALRSTYPSPAVIEVKLQRIRERQAQRSR